MDSRVALIRRWAVEWLAGGDPSVCDEILTPGYELLIGGHRLEGREAYVEATMAQLQRFPGLGVTVHELVYGADRVAVRLTEHGVDIRRERRAAAWGAIALFAFDGERLSGCVAEEDYLARRRQLDSAICDAIEPPTAAPWAAEPTPEDPAAERVVRDWLRDGSLDAVTLDDGWLGHPVGSLLEDVRTEIDEIFSAGAQVAFHARQTGCYVGDLGETGGRRGSPAAHHLAGIVTVRDGSVRGGRVVRDRLGLSRALRGSAS